MNPPSPACCRLSLVEPAALIMLDRLSADDFDRITTVVGIAVTLTLVAVLVAIDVRLLTNRPSGRGLVLASVGLGALLVGIGVLRFDRLATG